MSNTEWKMRPLGEVTYEQSSRAGKSFSGLPVYGVDSKIGLTNVPKYVAKKLDKYKVVEPGMFAYNPMRLNIGSIGLCKYSYTKGLVSPDYVVFGCDTENLLPEFLNYAIQGLEWRQWTSAAGVGSVRVRVYYKELARLSLTIPPVNAQKNIVKILSTLDDKIELNRQINQTLEQIAQAIFKSWFVDFEPVKAKIEAKASGRDPERAAMCAISGKLEPELDQLPPEQRQQLAATAALFPDVLVESELGLLPKGWEEGTLANLCVLNAKSWGVKTLPNQIYYVDLANTKDGEISEIQTFSGKEAPSRARRVLRPADTIVGTVRPGNRSFALIGSSELTLTGSTGFAVLSPKISRLREIVYLLATSESNIDRLARLADGAAYPAVRPGVVTDEQCVIPPDDLLVCFHRVVGPIFDQRLNNTEESDTLSALRDSLLPKLLSGEINCLEASK